MLKTIYAASQIDKGDSTLAPFTESFLRKFERELEDSEAEPDSTIRVSVTLGSLAYTYEKIRNTVEYKGENVVRRNAIERILKRLLWEKPLLHTTSHDRVAANLLRELVWARYLPNGKIPTRKVSEVKKILEKYTRILNDASLSQKRKKVIEPWLWGIASSEIEDALDPSNREFFVDLMYNWFRANFTWANPELEEDEKNLQIYLAVHRAYLKSDEAIMRYHLLEKIYPSWGKHNSEEVSSFAENFESTYKQIENSLNHPKKFTLYRKVKKYVAPFQIFQSIAQEEKHSLRSLLLDEKKLDKKVKKACVEKYKLIKERIGRSLVRSVLYIFITKIFIAILIEIPYELITLGTVNPLSLTINLFFPPTVMGLIGLTIKPPGDKNTQEILKRLKSVVYKEKGKPRVEFVLTSEKDKSSLSRLFTFMYTLLFLFVFALTAYTLSKLEFSLVASLIFFGFMSLVLLFATKIKHSANEIKVTGDDSFVSQLLELLLLPFLNLGFYLSRGFSKLNIFIVILDFLIEAPFKSIIEIAEDWTNFIRNKKDEVINLPE